MGAARLGFGHPHGYFFERVLKTSHSLDPAGASGVRQPSGAPLFES